MGHAWAQIETESTSMAACQANLTPPSDGKGKRFSYATELSLYGGIMWRAQDGGKGQIDPAQDRQTRVHG